MDKNLHQNAKAPMIALILFNLFAFSMIAQAQFGGGTGAYHNPYIIATTDHWLALADSVNSGNDYIDKYFRLDNDLDFSGINFNPIGGAWLDGNDTYFRGTFDGDNHHILNVRVGGTSNIGLFGCLDYGTVKNLTLGGNSRIEGKLFVGGIAGSGRHCGYGWSLQHHQLPCGKDRDHRCHCIPKHWNRRHHWKQ